TAEAVSTTVITGRRTNSSEKFTPNVLSALASIAGIGRFCRGRGASGRAASRRIGRPGFLHAYFAPGHDRELACDHRLLAVRDPLRHYHVVALALAQRYDAQLRRTVRLHHINIRPLL